MALGSVEASDVELPDPAAVRVLVRAGVARAGGSAVRGLDFNESLLAFPLNPAGKANGVAEISGLSVTGTQGPQTVLVAGIWGCTMFCGDGGDDACVHSLLHVPVALGLMPDSQREADGTSGVSSEYPRAVFGDLARMKTGPLACQGMGPSRATTLALPHLRVVASATVAVIGVGGLGPLSVLFLRASTASGIVEVDTAAVLRLAADRDGTSGSAASHSRAIRGSTQATEGLAVRSRFDFAGRLANAIVANYGALVAAGRGTGSFVIDRTCVGLP